MSLFIPEPEKVSVLVEITRLYHLLPVIAAGSHQARIGYSGIARVPFQAAAAISDKQAEENSSHTESEQRKT